MKLLHMKFICNSSCARVQLYFFASRAWSHFVLAVLLPHAGFLASWVSPVSRSVIYALRAWEVWCVLWQPSFSVICTRTEIFYNFGVAKLSGTRFFLGCEK